MNRAALFLALLAGCAQPPTPTVTRAPQVVLVDDLMGATEEALIERFGPPCEAPPPCEGGRRLLWPAISNTVIRDSCLAWGWSLEVRIRDGVAVRYAFGESDGFR